MIRRYDQIFIALCNYPFFFILVLKTESRRKRLRGFKQKVKIVLVHRFSVAAYGCLIYNMFFWVMCELETIAAKLLNRWSV